MSPLHLKAATTLALLAAAFLICSIAPCEAQENAQLQIPPSLVECYNTSYFMNRDNRLPSTIDSLISLIEKVENSNDYNMDIRTLAVALLQRFRQDGIQRAPGVVATAGVIPYSPTGFQFPKFRILLSRLIPGNALNFPNNSLTSQERCSLHFMLSSSFDTRIRGDENQVCGQLSQYRAHRLPRAFRDREDDTFNGDVEILENFNTNKKAQARGAPQAGRQVRPASSADDFGWSEIDYGTTNDNSISQCPVENGVIRTRWGTVAAGTLIAGIASGLQQQTVQLKTLLAFSRRPGASNAPQTATVNVDNRWAATLAGDLAEVALVQMPHSQTGSAIVGANGAWNNTAMPKWYFLTQRQNLEMTDAEIRGGLDGLILAMNVASWRTQASNLKLSQLLRMYYSMDGVLGSGIMACNRKDNFATFAPQADMIAQTSAFAQVLDREMQLKVTLSPTAIATFSTSAAQALITYVPQSLNDVSCSVSNALPQDVSDSITAMTNIYVFLDTSWQYSNVVDYVIYVLNMLNINTYASSVTLLAAGDGSLIVNTTNSMNDIYQNWNATSQAQFATGFNLPTILRTVQNLTQIYMNGEKTNNSVGGRSLVALLIPYMTTLNEADSNYATTQLQLISEIVPDLKFIYYGGGSMSRFNSFVQDPSQDLYSLNMGAKADVSSRPVGARIKKIPRRIINPRCGSLWYTNSWGTDQMYQYVSPGNTNFYRVAPNYFFGSGSGRYVNIQSQNSNQFTVCSSRTNPLPGQNNGTTGSTSSSTSTDQNCVQITGNQYSYDLSSSCNGYNTIHQCPPVYLSVAAPSAASGSGQTVSCSDNACQTPDQQKFTVSVVNLSCYSGAASMFASIVTIAMASLLRQLLE